MFNNPITVPPVLLKLWIRDLPRLTKFLEMILSSRQSSKPKSIIIAFQIKFLSNTSYTPFYLEGHVSLRQQQLIRNSIETEQSNSGNLLQLNKKSRKTFECATACQLHHHTLQESFLSAECTTDNDGDFAKYLPSRIMKSSSGSTPSEGTISSFHSYGSSALASNRWIILIWNFAHDWMPGCLESAGTYPTKGVTVQQSTLVYTQLGGRIDLESVPPSAAHELSPSLSRIDSLSLISVQFFVGATERLLFERSRDMLE